MAHESWAAGVDIGGTKIKIIQFFASGAIGEQIKIPTNIEEGPKAIAKDIVDTIHKLSESASHPACAVGIGVAGQVDGTTGVVKFAPNLKWENVPLQEDISTQLGVPVVTMNDVRAATWGEWLHGAGKGSDNVLCVFIGTGIGGGIVCGGEMLEGFNNTAGEIGHITVAIDGPPCTCGNWGCMEAFGGGWALAKRAEEALRSSKDADSLILDLVDGDLSQVKGMHVMEAVSKKDPLATQIVAQAVEAIAAGVSGLVNSVSPERVIFGGGVVEGNPWLVDRIAPKIRERSLDAALSEMEILRAKLHNNAGAIGGGALAIRKHLTVSV